MDGLPVTQRIAKKMRTVITGSNTRLMRAVFRVIAARRRRRIIYRTSDLLPVRMKIDSGYSPQPYGNQEIMLAPCVCALRDRNTSERVARSLIEESHRVLAVIDSCCPERDIMLCIEAMDCGKSMAALFARTHGRNPCGVEIDIRSLEMQMRVPVAAFSFGPGKSRAGDIFRMLENACAPQGRQLTRREKWIRTGELLDECMVPE